MDDVALSPFIVGVVAERPAAANGSPVGATKLFFFSFWLPLLVYLGSLRRAGGIRLVQMVPRSCWVDRE